MEIVKIKDKIIKSPSDDELANRWIVRFPDTIYGLGCFRRYKEGVWDEISSTQVQKEILNILIEAKSEGVRPNSSRLNSVTEISRILTTISNDNFDRGSNIIVFKNGTLHRCMSTTSINSMGIFLPHCKDDYITASLPYDYDPNAVPETWLKVLSRLSSEVVSFLQEYFGYCLTRETKHEIAIWLIGPAGCGKSSIIGGIQAMAGPLAVQLSISDIERSKFALPLIVGKNIIYSTEQFTFAPTNIDNVNKIVSGEFLMIEEKYEKPFNYLPYPKIFWASTEIPNIPPGDGFYRRFMVIKLPPLHLNEKDLDIKELIKQEGPGILNWALEGLTRLGNRGRFLIPQSVTSATDQCQAENNIIQEFTESCCEIGAGYKIQTSHIYTVYCDWCLVKGHAFKSIKKIAKDWENLGFTKKQLNGLNYWVGMRLKSEFPLEKGERENIMFN